MQSIPRVRSAVVATTLLAVLLMGCASADAAPAPTPSDPSPTPTVEPVFGESALPLGCADLVDEAEIAAIVPELRYVVDEDHLVPDATEVAAAQAGGLFCGWGDPGYRGSGWSDGLEVRVIPSTDTEISSDSDEYGVPFIPVDAAHPTSVGHCVATGGYAHCEIVQLRSGYRVDLEVWTQRPTDAAIRATADGLLEQVGGVIDQAGTMRTVEQPQGSTDPAILCGDPGIRSVATARGANGDPAITTSTAPGGIAVTTCAWKVADPFGSGIVYDLTVEVVPGGAWALPALADQIGFRSLTRLGDYAAFTEMDAFGVVRPFGSDLVWIVAPSAPTDPEAWEQLLAETW